MSYGTWLEWDKQDKIILASPLLLFKKLMSYKFGLAEGFTS